MTDRQQLIVNNVDTVKQLILDAERWIWAHPQTGYTEWQAHDYLVEKYEALGYTLVKAGNIPGFLFRRLRSLANLMHSTSPIIRSP